MKSVNRFESHVFIIPEDDADRQIARGFMLHACVDQRRARVVEPAGGWARVLDVFVEEYVRLLNENQHTHVVMLIDFDGNPDSRRAKFDAIIPEEARSRAFVIGPHDKPETLRKSLGKGYEDIGRALADDCAGDRTDTWDHEQLRHNESDRVRLYATVRDFLFRRQ